MKNMEELAEYIEKTEDVQLAMMVEIVKEYGNKIPEIIKAIKDKHIGNDDKENAEMIFSTVHRCKGMEYDTIQLVNDFITKEKLEKHKAEIKQDGFNSSKLNEEINLLYVAITRAKNSIHIPETIIPVDFPASPQIHILRVLTEEEKQEKNKEIQEKPKLNLKKEISGKSYSVNEVRVKYKHAYSLWNQELDDELTIMYCEGVNVKDLARHFERTRGAIRSRIKKLELE